MNDITDEIVAYYSTLKLPEIIKPDHKYIGELTPVNLEQATKIEKTYLAKLPVVVGVGARWQTMRNYAALLRGLGFKQDDITNRIKKFNSKRCDPPKTDAELATDINKYMTWVMSLPIGMRKQEKQNPVQNLVEKTEEQAGEEAITKDTDVMKIYLDAFHVNSSDIDDDFAKYVLLSRMGGYELNGDGLHLKPSGESGEGKSYSMNAALFTFPQDRVYTGAFTDKALVYDTVLRDNDGMIIKIDEGQGKSDSFDSILKEAASTYQTPMKYTVTNVDRTDVQRIQLAKRMTFIILSVDAIGDEQLRSRLLPLPLASRVGKSKNITDFRLQKRLRGEPKLNITDAVIRCRKVIQHFQNRSFKAYIPFVANIKYNITDQRTQEFFENCMMYSAVLNYMRREHNIDDDGVIHVYASKEDFTFCLTLPAFKSVTHLVERIDKTQIHVIDTIKKSKKEGTIISKKELCELCGLSDVRMAQVMNGREDRQKSGLRSVFNIGEVNRSIAEYSPEDKDIPKGHLNIKCYELPYFPNVGTLGTSTVENHIAVWDEKEDLTT